MSRGIQLLRLLRHENPTVVQLTESNIPYAHTCLDGPYGDCAACNPEPFIQHTEVWHGHEETGS
jgi:hypothetical protein